MPSAPLVVAWSNVTAAWSSLKGQPTFRAALRSCLRLSWLAIILAYQMVWIIFRSFTSIMVLVAALILGGVLGYFCFLGSSSAVGLCLQGALATHLLDVKNATAASKDVMAVGGISSLFSVGFLAWKRWPEFAGALRAAWRWVWIGGIAETTGLVAALSKQLIVYAGLVFAVFVIDRIAKDEPQPPKIGIMQPVDSGQNRALMNEIFDTKIETMGSIVSVEVKKLRDQVTELKTELESRGGLIVYVDRTSNESHTPAIPRTTFDLIYVAFFDNASFSHDSTQGRALGSAERKRLVDFARSLRHISEVDQATGGSSDQLRIEVRGFASEAPKAGELQDKDKLNVQLANDRACSVHAILKDTLKDVAVVLGDPKVWREPAEMRADRQFDDRSVRRPQRSETTLAEAPNRRVEILVTLPKEFRFHASDVAELSTIGH